MYPGDVPKMGSTITRGESEAIVTGTGAETFFGKTAALIEGVDELGHFEKVLREIMWMLVGAGSIVTVRLRSWHWRAHTYACLRPSRCIPVPTR